MVRKLGLPTLLVKVDFKGLKSAVAFVNFFMSVMAFKPKLIFAAAWLMSAAALKAFKFTKYAKKTSKIKLTTSQIFNDVINFSVALPGQIYRL